MVAFELRQVEIRARSAGGELGMVVEQVEPEIDQRARHPRHPCVRRKVLLLEMPAARPDDQHCGMGAQPIRFALGRGEIDLPTHRVAQVRLPAHHVVPGRRQRILAIRHEHLGAGIERVDDHLPIGGPGDLHTPIEQISRDRGDPPVAVADRAGLGQEVGQLAAIEPGLTRVPIAEEGLDARRKTVHQFPEERQCVRREDPLVGGTGLGARGYS